VNRDPGRLEIRYVARHHDERVFQRRGRDHEIGAVIESCAQGAPTPRRSQVEWQHPLAVEASTRSSQAASAPAKPGSVARCMGTEFFRRDLPKLDPFGLKPGQHVRHVHDFADFVLKALQDRGWRVGGRNDAVPLGRVEAGQGLGDRQDAQRHPDALKSCNAKRPQGAGLNVLEYGWYVPPRQAPLSRPRRVELPRVSENR
jgi:hypothetical protein